ncbi:MAG: HAMP domain-containing histidine kinase [Saprospiraceae bacterium]|nr:HAMP domain-containing histidine kinase [Saprospiraceae bacterium]
MQIRSRLTLLYLAIAAFILALVLVAVWLVFKKDTEENFYKNLRSQAQLAANNPQFTPEKTTAMWSAPETDTLPYLENVSVYNDAYERVFSLYPEAVPVSVKVLQDIQTKGEVRFSHYNLQALGMTYSSNNQQQFVVIAEGYCDDAALWNLSRILLAGYFLGLGLMAGGGWYFSGKALQPVSNIVGEVEAMQPTDLSRRVDTGGKQDELGRLAETFNRLLDRVEKAFQMQRMFLSNVSHEMRNPLQALRSQLEVTLQRPREVEQYRQALASVLDDVNYMHDMEEKLLLLARIYNDPAGIVMEPLRLDELLWQSKSQVQKQHPQYKISLDFEQLPETDDALNFVGNEVLLRSALINLMENGAKYGGGQLVTARLNAADGSHVNIEILDRGPGIPEAELPLLFEPFYRLERHRGNIKGTGIGLSLVKNVLDVHGIRLEVVHREGGGSIFRLLFPTKTAA